MSPTGSGILANYPRAPVVFTKGQGSYLWDETGRRYLDFASGIAVNALGHADPELTSIISEQAGLLLHTSNLWYNDWLCKASELLVRKTRESGCMEKAHAVFFCNSGSEANEAALKFARKVGRLADPSGAKHEVVSFHGSYHGLTMGALSATPRAHYQGAFTPLVPGFRYGTYNDAAGADALITERTCAVILEPVQGEGGVYVGTDEFLTRVAARARAVGAMVIYDEVQCGLARTGALWAHPHLPAAAQPDVITTAKALGNGFPVAATIVTRQIDEAILAMEHATTYGGNPMACRVAHYMVSRLSEPGFQEDVNRRAGIMWGGFLALQKKFPETILEVRGKGFLIGVQLSRDPRDVMEAARAQGLLVITAQNNTLRVLPSLAISEDEIREGLSVLDAILEKLPEITAAN